MSAQAKTALRSALFQDLLAAHGTRLVRFGLVGASGVMLNTVVLYALVTMAGMNHLLAAAFSSEVSILTNFTLNDRWTFRDATKQSSWLYRAAQYNTVALFGMVISVTVLALLTNGLGVHYLVANLFAIGAATVSNYLLNTHFTWTLPGRSPRRQALRVGVLSCDLEAVAVPVSPVKLGLDRHEPHVNG